MEIARTSVYASVLSAGILCCSGAFADKCVGYNVNHMISMDTVEMAKGDTLTTFRHSSVHVSEDPKSSFHMAVGECGGTLVTTPDGKTRGSGNCTRVDKDGDAYNEEWTMPTGSEWKGTWKVTSGTGKYANAAWVGTWGVVLSQGKDGAVSWVGNCQ